MYPTLIVQHSAAPWRYAYQDREEHNSRYCECRVLSATSAASLEPGHWDELPNLMVFFFSPVDHYVTKSKPGIAMAHSCKTIAQTCDP